MMIFLFICAVLMSIAAENIYTRDLRLIGSAVCVDSAVDRNGATGSDAELCAFWCAMHADCAYSVWNEGKSHHLKE